MYIVIHIQLCLGEGVMILTKIAKHEFRLQNKLELSAITFQNQKPVT